MILCWYCSIAMKTISGVTSDTYCNITGFCTDQKNWTPKMWREQLPVTLLRFTKFHIVLMYIIHMSISDFFRSYSSALFWEGGQDCILTPLYPLDVRWSILCYFMENMQSPKKSSLHPHSICSYSSLLEWWDILYVKRDSVFHVKSCLHVNQVRLP